MLSTLPILLLLAADEEAAARKVLAARCWACHAQTALGGLRLDSRDAMLRGGNSGPALVPGDVAASRLWRAVNHAPGVKAMPPGSALSADEKSALAAWIRAGASWSDSREHWAFQTLAKTASGASIDAILAAAQKSKGLAANPAADHRTQLRRLSFDLIGLPPDSITRRYEDAVNEWLASPHFGEKWGRHWLDVARYGEDDFSGTAVIPYENAWRYRDWVVAAFNRDLPYDKFLQAQLAGDLLPDPSLLPATGLFGAGPWYYGISQPPQARADERNDRVDMVSRGMLGVTLACARCHDHKYDPFSIHDYYALAGVFASTAYKEYPLVSDSAVAAWKQRKKAKDDAEKKRNEFLDQQKERLAADYARHTARYMMATIDKNFAQGLEPKVVARWKEYLAKPEESHPFLKDWFAGHRTLATAQAFEKLLLEILAEKKALDDENKKVIETAKQREAKPRRTIVLPGGYRSDEDFNPGAYIPIKSLERDRYVAWNRTFNDKNSPLQLGRELTAELLRGAPRQEAERLRRELTARTKDLPPQYPFLMGSAEFEPWDLELHLRGNPEQLGEAVPRRFPPVLGGQPLREGSGRLELARLVSHHPLAARVAVNRIWMALFGEGLVRTPSNFGKLGDRPAVPELLEYLATRFVASGYSVKTLIKEIVLSDAYRRASSHHAANHNVDPGNRYLWRQSRRRLEAEPLRDAMLAASGELDRRIGGPSAALDEKFRRRTLYAKTGRFQQEETLSLFDLPAAAVTCEQRVVTNVPLQKLFFLNSEVLSARAAALARRIAQRQPERGIALAYQLLYQREPSARELAQGRDFLTSARREKHGPTPWAQYAQVLLSTNEFAYVD